MGSRGDQLSEFLYYLDQSLAKIEGLCDSTHDGQCRSFKRALLFAFIDNLSTLAYPGPKSSATKVRKLLSEYGCWQEIDNVSTPHLCRWIELNPDGLTPKGNETIRAKLKSWESGHLIPISLDPDLASIQKLENRAGGGAAASLRGMTHFSLLWNQRHNLIHRFMPIGMNLEFPDDTCPYYVHLSSLASLTGKSGEGVFWQLIHPIGFLFQLAKTCLVSVSAELRERKFDVTAHYRAGLFLLEELNQPPQNSGSKAY